MLSAFSCVYIVSAIAGLLVFGLLFLSMPGLFEKISSLQNSFVTISRMVQEIQSLALPASGVMLLITIASLAIIGLGLIIGFYIIYRIFASVKETSRFSNLVFACISLGLMLVADLILRVILSAIL